MNNDFDWPALIRQALSAGLGGQNYSDERGPQTTESVNLGDWTALLAPGGGYNFSRQRGDNYNDSTVYGVDSYGGQTGNPWEHTSQGTGIGSILTEAAKTAAPIALAALGANYLGPMLGDFLGGGVGSMGISGAGAGGGGIGTLGTLAPSTALAPVAPIGATPLAPGLTAAEIGGIGAGGVGGGSALAGGGAAAGGINPATAGWFPGEGVASGIPAWDGAAKAAGVGLSSTPGAGFLSSLGDLGGLAKVAAPLLGAVAGSQSTPGAETTNRRTLDHRMDAMVFGANGSPGLLGDATAWYQANKSGQNDTMRTANDQLKGLLTDPRVMQGLYTQGGTGIGMMQGGMAANPFTRAGFNGTNWGG